MIKRDLPKNIVGFVLKPDSTSQQIIALFENELNHNGFIILDSSRKKLTESEIELLHCVKGHWKYDPVKYKEYMMQDETIGYLVKHTVLCSNSLFVFSKELRGAHYEAYNCKDNSLRGKIHNILNKREPYENYLHVTDSKEELNAFINIYFPRRYL